MHKKLSSIILLALLLQAVAFTRPASAGTQADRQARHEAKVKKAVGKLGVGKDARVKIKLQDGRKIEGYVREVKEDAFVVAESGTGGTTAVSYRDVKEVKGHNLSTGAKIAIGVGIAFAVLAILVIIGLHQLD